MYNTKNKIENNNNPIIDYNNINKIYLLTCYSCNKEITSLSEKNECLLCNLSNTSKTNDDSSIIVKTTLVNIIDNEIKPCSIVITESSNYLNPTTYSKNSILHLGISDSKCNVHNFWFKYKKEKASDNKIWKRVVNISLLESNKSSKDGLDNSISDYALFDNLLQQDFDRQMTLYPNYHQFNNNCFDYVVRFLNSINYLSKKDWDKEGIISYLINDYIEKLETYCLRIQMISKNSNRDNDKDKDSKEIIDYSIASISDNKTDIENTKSLFKLCDICGVDFEIKEECFYFHCDQCEDYDLCGECYSYYGHNHNK